jgi:hypothetical protein
MDEMRFFAKVYLSEHEETLLCWSAVCKGESAVPPYTATSTLSRL